MAIKRERFATISNTAKRQEKPLAELLTPVLMEQIKQFSEKLIDAGKDPNVRGILAALENEWTAKLIAAKGDYPLKMAVHGYKMTAAWIGRKSYLDDMLAKAQNFTVDASVDLWGADEATAIHLKPNVGEWIANTSKIETKTSSKWLEEAYHTAMGTYGADDSMDIMEFAEYLVKEGLAWDLVRARLMARTITNWAYNEGSEQNYADYGIETKEWMTTRDDATCDLCAPMNGKRNGIGKNYLNEGQYYEGDNEASMVAEFDIKHPPLHPNCRCCIIPIIPGLE